MSNKTLITGCCLIILGVGLVVYDIWNGTFFTPPTKTTYDNNTHVHDVSWTIDAIQKIRPKWTKEKCLDFFIRYHDHVLNRTKIEMDIVISNLIIIEEMVLSTQPVKQQQ